MKKVLALLALTLTLACGSIPLKQTIPVALKSVGLVQFNEKGICTAFSINETGKWVTAGHCVDGTVNVRVNGVAAKTLKFDSGIDLAIVQAGSAPALTLGSEPDLGDLTVVIGHVTRSAPFSFFGHVSVTAIDVTDDTGVDKNVMMLHEGGGPGTSGAPVIGDDGVIGVVLGGAQFPSHMVMASKRRDVAKFTDGYWEQKKDN